MQSDSKTRCSDREQHETGFFIVKGTSVESLRREVPCFEGLVSGFQIIDY